ncbi:hypothetical protein ABH966_001072 [Lysinibacillus sp. RC46]|uniref:hypothetical protein n=1 Tax=Lysinibacillus sp. RC46 TaxID=3156295 RepID=UPI0035182351
MFVNQRFLYFAVTSTLQKYAVSDVAGRWEACFFNTFLKMTCKPRGSNPYDFYLEKQVLLDKFDMLLKKLYRMPEAAFSVDEGAISVLFSLFHQFESFHLPNQLVPMLMNPVV